MPRPNTTGRPNTLDYNLGRGVIYIAPLTEGVPGPFRDFGNAPEFNISIETETLEHQSSREGLRNVDRELTLSKKINISLSGDEINMENLALFLAGESYAKTNAAIAGFAKHEMISDAVLGRWYDIQSSAGVRAYDISATDVTVEIGANTIAAAGNYELDLTMGRIFILSDAAAIDAEDDIDVTLAAKAGARTLTELDSLSQSDPIVQIKFIAINPADENRQTEYTFHQVTLKSEGDFGLISDDWTQMSFTGVVELNSASQKRVTILTLNPAAA